MGMGWSRKVVETAMPTTPYLPWGTELGRYPAGGSWEDVQRKCIPGRAKAPKAGAELCVPPRTRKQVLRAGKESMRRDAEWVTARTWHFLLSGVERKPWEAQDRTFRMGYRSKQRDQLRQVIRFSVFDRMWLNIEFERKNIINLNCKIFGLSNWKKKIWDSLEPLRLLKEQKKRERESFYKHGRVQFGTCYF